MRHKNMFSGKLFTSLCIVSIFSVLFVFSGYQSASAQAAKVIELKIGHQNPTVHYTHTVFEAWAKKIEEQAKGRIHFTIIPGGALAPSPEVYNAVVKGVMDIGFFAEGFTPQRFPLQLGAMYAIMGAPSAEVATRVRLDLYNKFPEIRDEYKDVKVLFLYSTAAVNLHTTFPVRTLKDLKGKQIRVAPGIVPWIKALGAVPVNMTMDETYLALNKKIVDGLISSDETLKSFRLAEVTKYTTKVNLFVSPFSVIMNKKVWESLPPDIQKIIDDLSEWAAIEDAKGCDAEGKAADDFAKTLKHEFITPTPQALEEIYTQVKPLNETWAKDMDAKGKPGTKIIEEINASLKQYTAKPAVKPAAKTKK